MSKTKTKTKKRKQKMSTKLESVDPLVIVASTSKFVTVSVTGFRMIRYHYRLGSL